MQNTVKIGSLPNLAHKIRKQEETNPHYIDIVDHALKEFLKPDEFRTVVDGYRRSPWSEQAFTTDLGKLDSPEHHVIKDEHYYNALQKTYEIFKPEFKLRPIHFADLRYYPWPLSTNIGAPFATSPDWIRYINEKFDTQFTKPYYRDFFFEAHHTTFEPRMIDRRMTKRNLYNEMFYINRRNIHHIKRGRKTNPHGHDLRYWHTAFARQHLVKADDEDKVRLVFGAPSLLLMAELMFIWPFQISLMARGEKSPMLWGFETITGGWNRLYSWAHRTYPFYNSVLTLDWSGFDRFARHTVIRDIHQLVLRPMFDFDHGYHPTIDYAETRAKDPTHLENLWNWMTDAILTTPLLLPDGDLLRFQHSGIYSGYFQTQIMDSLYNCVNLFTCLSRMGLDLSEIALKVQGDDSIVLLPYQHRQFEDSFLPLLSHYASKYFGAVVSEKKSEFLPSLQGAEVLKYRNHGGMPTRDELGLLAMLRHPERTSSLEALMARSIGIAYANCGSHPRVHLICEDIYEYLAKSGFSPNAAGLPHGMRFRQSYVPGYEQIDLSHFPTYFETVRHLMDPTRNLVTEKHWPQKYFIGLPGESQA